MFLGKFDTPSIPKIGEDPTHGAGTDISVHCNFFFGHCGGPKPNNDPVDDFRNGFSMPHDVK